MKILLVLIIIASLSECCLFALKGSNTTHIYKITKYLHYVAEYYKNKEQAVTVVHDEQVADIANKFIQEMSPCPVLLAHADFANWHFGKPKTTFIFVENIAAVERKIPNLKHSTDPWSTPDSLIFVVFKSIDDRILVRHAAETIWKYGLLDFLLIYHHGDVEAVEYNPFLKTFIQINFLDGTVVASNKLKNMAGYPLKVTLFDDPPRITRRDGDFHGTDVGNLRRLIKKLNATLIVKIPEGNSTDTFFRGYVMDMINGAVDFGMVSSFLFLLNLDVRVSYPRRMDDVVAVVPAPQMIPQYRYLSLVFSENLWLAVLLALSAVSLAKYIVHRHCSGLLSSILEVSAMLLGKQIEGLENSTAAVKILLTQWCFCAMILNVAFQCCLTSIIITPKYEKQIETLEELTHSNLEVLINQWHRMIAGQDKSLNACLVTDTETNIIRRMMRGDTSKAYAVQLSVAEEIVPKVFREKLPVYHIVREHVVPGFSVYLFPAVSPYVEETNRFLLLDQQFGLSKYNLSDRAFAFSGYSTAELVPLNLSHLQTVFYILVVGYLVSIIVLFLEILTMRLCCKK